MSAIHIDHDAPNHAYIRIDEPSQVILTEGDTAVIVFTGADFKSYSMIITYVSCEKRENELILEVDDTVFSRWMSKDYGVIEARGLDEMENLIVTIWATTRL